VIIRGPRAALIEVEVVRGFAMRLKNFSFVRRPATVCFLLRRKHELRSGNLAENRRENSHSKVIGSWSEVEES
jgi:hypothetical protein